MNRIKILEERVRHLESQNNKLLAMIHQYQIFICGLVEWYQRKGERDEGNNMPEDGSRKAQNISD